MKVFLARLKNEGGRASAPENPPPKYTDHSVHGSRGVLGEVERARELGYATDLEEYRKGVRGVAALVYRGSDARAAIAIFGLAGSMDDRRMPEIISHITNTAQAVSKKLSLMAKDRGGSEGGAGPSLLQEPNRNGSNEGVGAWRYVP